MSSLSVWHRFRGHHSDATDRSHVSQLSQGRSAGPVQAQSVLIGDEDTLLSIQLLHANMILPRSCSLPREPHPQRRRERDELVPEATCQVCGNAVTLHHVEPQQAGHRGLCLPILGV